MKNIQAAPALMGITLLLFIVATIGLVFVVRGLQEVSNKQAEISWRLEALEKELDQTPGGESQASTTGSVQVGPAPTATRKPTATPAPKATQTQPAEPTPAATPTPMPTEALTTVTAGEGICGRSPHVQRIILTTLRSNSCRQVTNEELYRITWFSDLRGYRADTSNWELKPGDLSGLVNLEELTIGRDAGLPGMAEFGTSGTLPAGAFAGAGIIKLTLTDVILEPGTFDGVVSIGSLNYRGQEFPPIGANGLSNLEELVVEVTDMPPVLDGTELSHMTNLESVSLAAYLPPGKELPRSHSLPNDLFKNNSNLRSVKIGFTSNRGAGSLTEGRSFTPSNLVAHLENIESLEIDGLHSTSHQPGQPPLELAPESPLAQYLTFPVMTLLEYSQQYRAIKRWANWTNGQTISVNANEEE